MPFPGLGTDKTARLGVFFDAGTVGQKYSEPFRYSVGLSVLWVSPLGPLKVSFSSPIHATPLDRRQPFQFTFGGAF
jgi:outer membrane protein insertion porin family